MRIYKVNLEHRTAGFNWRAVNVHAKSFSEAVKKASKKLRVNEKIESVELLASAEL